jgi:hypothetical protein
MQLPAYCNEEVRHLAAAIALAWCGEEHHLTLTAHLPGNGGSARMSDSLKYNLPSDLAYSNPPYQMLTEKWFWKCVSVDASLTEFTDSKKFHQLHKNAHIFVTTDFRTYVYWTFSTLIGPQTRPWATDIVHNYVHLWVEHTKSFIVVMD